MKKFFAVIGLSLLLLSCDSGDSDSGGMLEPTLPGTDVPASFVGVYSGTLNLSASALGLTQSDSFPITITVSEDGQLRFDGDSPEETFTVGLENGGAFRGSLNINEEECTGSAALSGTVDGTTASGTLSGDGVCRFDGANVDVTLSGDFSASR